MSIVDDGRMDDAEGHRTFGSGELKMEWKSLNGLMDTDMKISNGY